jgi:hypothetical protein
MAVLAFGRVHVTLCRSVLRWRRENRAAPMERCFGSFQSGETLFTRRAAACSDRGTEEGAKLRWSAGPVDLSVTTA